MINYFLLVVNDYQNIQAHYLFDFILFLYTYYILILCKLVLILFFLRDAHNFNRLVLGHLSLEFLNFYVFVHHFGLNFLNYLNYSEGLKR